MRYIIIFIKPKLYKTILITSFRIFNGLFRNELKQEHFKSRYLLDFYSVNLFSSLNFIHYQCLNLIRHQKLLILSQVIIQITCLFSVQNWNRLVLLIFKLIIYNYYSIIKGYSRKASKLKKEFLLFCQLFIIFMLFLFSFGV